MARLKKAKLSQAIPTEELVQEQKPIGIIPVSQEEKVAIVSKGQAELEKIQDEYQVNEIPERITKRLNLVMEAPTLEEAELRVKKTLSAMQMHALAMWAVGKAFGPTTPENIERKIKKTETLIKFLYNKALDDQVKQQQAKLDNLRNLLTQYRRKNG